MIKINPVFSLIRPKHWIKNLIIFSSIIFAFDFNIGSIGACFGAFLCFCLISSAIYILNDIKDIESDKLHPIKKNRPLAKGELSINKGKLLFLFFIFLSYIVSYALEQKLFLVIFIYSIIQTLYCFSLKDKPILDIFCISSGFFLRAISGAAVTNNPLSPWFLSCIGLISLFLAIEKRKAELNNALTSGIFNKKVLRKYKLPLLLKFENTVISSSFMTYSLWAAGPNLGGAKSSWMLITAPLVLLGLFRYQLIGENSRDINLNKEFPEQIFLKDKGMQLIIFIWFLITLTIGFIFQ